MEQNRKVTLAVKIVLTLVIGLPGFALVGFLKEKPDPTIGNIVGMGLVGALMTIWYYRPK